MRVPHFLADQQVAFETLIHPPAYTAQRRAKSLQIPGRLVVKAVLMHAPGGYLLAVLPATRQLDLDRLSGLLGGCVRLATAGEVRQIFRDCEIGAISPFGSLYGLASILDDSVDPSDLIAFEGHTHFHAIRMSCRDYERLERPRRLAFTIAAPGRAAASVAAG
jgi:Ala-tRNA(Pro) deacylase